MTLTQTQIREYDRRAMDSEETATVTFGIGCFWGPDSQFGAMDGVVRTRVGYAGGTKLDPSYHALGDHTEAVQVEFDPDAVAYRDLLDRVFDSHDPQHQTTKTQYQSIVSAETEDQRAVLDGSGEAFGCQKCGYENHADYNASKNIGLQYLRRRQNADDGGAPVDVRLNRGTLNVSGEYVPPASVEA